MPATTTGQIQDASAGNQQPATFQEGDFSACIMLAACGGTQKMSAEG
jgi:hypothetical protein